MSELRDAQRRWADQHDRMQASIDRQKAAIGRLLEANSIGFQCLQRIAKGDAGVASIQARNAINSIEEVLSPPAADEESGRD